MTQISAFLSLNGNCREVMTFYKECFDGELFILSVEESPVAATLPAESQKSILHANLFKGNLSLLAADIIPPMELLRGNGVALFIECSSEEEIYTYFSNLSSGGQINMVNAGVLILLKISRNKPAGCFMPFSCLLPAFPSSSPDIREIDGLYRPIWPIHLQ